MLQGALARGGVFVGEGVLAMGRMLLIKMRDEQDPDPRHQKHQQNNVPEENISSPIAGGKDARATRPTARDHAFVCDYLESPGEGRGAF